MYRSIVFVPIVFVPIVFVPIVYVLTFPPITTI